MNTETKEKVLLGHVWRSGAPFLAGDPTFCFGCGPSVGLPISGLALQKVDCKEAPTVVKPFHHNDEKSQGSPALLSHVEERTALPTFQKCSIYIYICVCVCIYIYAYTQAMNHLFCS